MTTTTMLLKRGAGQPNHESSICSSRHYGKNRELLSLGLIGIRKFHRGLLACQRFFRQKAVQCNRRKLMKKEDHSDE